MAVLTHYDKAPITEAIIDIQVVAPETVTLDALRSLQDRDSERYPDRGKVFRASVVVEDPVDHEGMSTQTSKVQRGWAFSSGDKLHVWQARRDGFTFSRMSPYESWEPFSSEARRVWNLTREVLTPTMISRAAVRYINRIEIPLPLKDFKDYLRTVPEVSPALPQGLLSFFMQLQIPQPDLNALLILNQTLAPPPALVPEPRSVSIILDIDLFCADNLPLDDDSLWNLFERFHDRKNEVFEGCITDATRRLIS